MGMIIYLFYTLNLCVLLSGLWAFRLSSRDSKFSLSLIQVMVCLPLLAAEYFSMADGLLPQMMPLILFSENVFALIWGVAAYRLYDTSVTDTLIARRLSFTGIIIGIAISGIAVYSFFNRRISAGKDSIFFPKYGIYFYCGMFLLFSMLVMVWRLEHFWRGLSPVNRWEYKFLVVGSFLICGALTWTVSYRLTYLRFDPDHFLLLSALLLFSWFLIIYAVVRHRLLNRRLFVSRKVVYAVIAPLAFALYLIFLGLIILLMHLFGLPLPVVLYWLLFVIGMTAIASMALSGKVRHSVKFFISTHFYINKYEYRDEWLAFSQLLKGALTETEIVGALHRVLAESLYTNLIFIWLGDDKQGYRLAFAQKISAEQKAAYHLAPTDSLISYLKQHHRYYKEEKGHEVLEEKTLFSELKLVLAVPLTIGEQLLGLIVLGPEFTGGRYGDDDFDLLSAIGTQAASALLAARMAEELSRTRQQEVWNIMSAFILHDIKNAAGMLSLIRQNAPIHLHDPEFQKDMLDTIDDSLKRMAKVQDRLSALKGEVSPVLREVCLCRVITDVCRKLAKRLRGLRMNIRYEKSIRVKTDPDLLLRMIENLFINSLEAGATEIAVEIKYLPDERQSEINLIDNGSGLPPEFIPDAIFEPFMTTKPKGSGIGLWQVKQIVCSLGGKIMAKNEELGGARFVITLPTDIATV
jgi:putative PEP-CTERM system histidine kinase